MTAPPRTEQRFRASAPLPRRSPAASFAERELDPPLERGAPPTLARRGTSALHAELSRLRQRVPGVRGCVLATMDGLLVDGDMSRGGEPHDLAVLAASAFGVGRQCGLGLRQGAFREATIRSDAGYFTVYAVTENALLAVLTDDGADIGWLHEEARPVAERIAELLSGSVP
ncbi:roadblock/LC7 domain-containing protein [Plantactinospora sp. GCM10030261]|uniref:roadblock/LC7 domain-containing protein n=1 Tax=Plantactinospora sp. GCM10030261 TaxID=3273420 RepID=UPI0036173347